MSNQLETNEISHRFFEEYLLVDLVFSVFFPAYIFKTITEALKLSYYPHLPVTRIPAGSRPEITSQVNFTGALNILSCYKLCGATK